MFKSFLKNESGGFALPAALSMLALVIMSGVAIDFGNVQSTKVQMQNQIDGAVLAAAVHMRETELHGTSVQSRKSSARKIAQNYLTTSRNGQQTVVRLEKFTITDSEVSAVGNVKIIPYFASLLGINEVTVKAAASANILSQDVKDVDLILIADATGSMALTLTAIQDNMKTFTWDLSTELTNSGIKLGTVRVQFIFYRDYMIDGHKNWTDPNMALLPGMEKYGPMYTSPFFTLPYDATKMDTYVDFFTAHGGGSARESGLEAIWHALNASWSGKDTVRSIVLWTDAPTRPLGDKVEEALLPATNLSAYWSDDYWTDAIGNFFAMMDQSQRENYMDDTFYPGNIPSTMTAFKNKFDQFHSENSNGVANVKTMTINVVNDCLGLGAACPSWPEVAYWDGAELIMDAQPVSSDATYDLIVKQVAETVVSQVAAKDLALTR